MESGPAPSQAVAAPGSGRFTYVAALDGLRAVAVALVLCFHTPIDGRSIVEGGFLGVDTFFVLSGFLITTLLLQERLRGGRVSLGNFYARRAYRLLPLVVAVLVVVAVVRIIWAPYWTGRIDPIAYVGGLAYFMNWIEVFHLGKTGILSPMWSLSVEEQFYLVWPLVLVVLTLRRVDRRVLLAVAIGGALAAAGWRAHLWLTGEDDHRAFLDVYLELTFRPPFIAPGGGASEAWNRIYFASDTRADSLLIGSALGILYTLWHASVRPAARRIASWAGWLGLACGIAILLRADIGDRGLPLWGFTAYALCVAGVVAALVLCAQHPLTRLLAAGPLVWIGKRSYGIYLLHIPVMTWVASWGWQQSMTVPAKFGVTLALAALSYRYLEQPILARARRFRS